MKHLFLKYHIELLAVIAALLFFTTREPQLPWDKTIGSDGKGYYAYLPAIFVYHDLNYSFVENYEQEHYQVTEDFFEFRQEVNGSIVNKYFPGVAILWIPFFLLAHLFCLFAGFPADGYSLPYQYAISFAAIFYLWLGLKFLEKYLLTEGFSKKNILWVLWLIFFGTNLYYYTIEEPSFTHVYSFALISFFVLTVKKLTLKYQPSLLYLLAIITGLIIIIRPVNGIIIFAIPFIAGSFSRLSQLFRNIFNDHSNLILSFTTGMIIIFIVPFLWYLQCGRWFVYTYGNEGFDFLSANFLNILFSFRNGWFVYTPLIVVSFTGFIFICKESFYKFFSLLIFLIIIIYVLSSWSVWWYGEGYGSRPFIEFYFIPAILLSYLTNFIRKFKSLKILFFVLSLMLIGFNLFQSWQFKNNILPARHLSKETYLASFFRFRPIAKVYLDDEKILHRTEFFTDMETDPGWLNYASVSDKIAFSGKYSSKIDSANIYSIGFRENIKDFCKADRCLIKVSALVFSTCQNPGFQLIIDFQNDKNKSVKYVAFNLKSFIKKSEWTYMEFATEVPHNCQDDCILAVYFYNSLRKDIFYVDDIKIEIITLI